MQKCKLKFKNTIRIYYFCIKFLHFALLLTHEPIEPRRLI